MSQKNDSVSLCIGPNKMYWWVFLIAAPAVIYGLIHLHTFHTYTGSACLGGGLGLSINCVIFGGLGMTISKDGINQTWFGFHLRQIPWNHVKDVCCYPEHNFRHTKVEKVTILIRTNDCKDDPPTYNIFNYYSWHLRKTLYIGHGDYSPAFERFTEVTYIPPKEEWNKKDDFPE